MKYLPDEIDQFTLMHIWNRMPEERKKRALRYKRDDDYKRCVLSYGLLCYALYKEYNTTFFELMIDQNNRKPYLCDDRLPCFNLSHSGSFVACALSESPIGIDVQVVDEMDVSLIDHFLSEEEKSALPNDNPKMFMTRAWALKESRIKMTGEGLSSNLKNISISYRQESSFEANGFFYFVKNINNNAYLSVCSGKPFISLNFNRVSCDEFVKVNSSI